MASSVIQLRVDIIDFQSRHFQATFALSLHFTDFCSLVNLHNQLKTFGVYANQSV